MKSSNLNPDRILNVEGCNAASKELVKKVVDFIWQFDKVVVQDFFIGVTNVPEKRLFEEHKVSRESKKFLILEAPVEDVALEAEKVLLSLDINGGFENDHGKYLYCYYIDGCTREFAMHTIFNK
jgi:hypothetical protein